MKVDNEVINVLSNAAIFGEFLTLPSYLTRPLYMRTNVVLEAAGGKWNRSKKAHVFPEAPNDLIDQIIITGEISIPQDFGYFPSPPAVVERIMELAEIRSRHRVLEPSAGRGAIAVEMSKVARIVDCIELLDANVIALRDLRRTGVLKGIDGIAHMDFLAASPRKQYDRIVMNPPFAKQADIHHVLHALQFLRPLGLLVAVMSAGVTFRDNKLTTQFRDLVNLREGTIEHLPDNSFASSGTAVNTVIVTIPGA
jgi:type I restriction-modification system DNA methylase subunit